MADLALVKQADGLLAPSGQEDAEIVRLWRRGEVIRVKATRMRNWKFHKKFFSLLEVGFDAWEPPQGSHEGLPTQKNFVRFRKDVIIATGRYTVTTTIDGDVRLEADSISFANMDDLEFERLYSDAANVLLQKVLTNYTRDDLDDVVQKVLGFV